MHPRRRVPNEEMRDVTSSSQQACLLSIDVSRKIGAHRYLFARQLAKSSRVYTRYRTASYQLREDPAVLTWARYEGKLPTSARLGRPASTGIHRGTSRTGRRHTPPSRHHGADLCHPRARPLTLSWTRPIGACESPPIALRGRHRARIKIFDFS